MQRGGKNNVERKEIDKKFLSTQKTAKLFANMMARYSCCGSHKEIGEDFQNRQKKVDRELKKQQAPQSLDFGGLVLFFPEKRRY